MPSPSQELPAEALPRPTAAPRRLRVCHVMSADLWAGAEVQVATVASYLVGRPDLEVSAVLLNEGRLARELRGLGVPVTVIDERRHGAIGILIALIRRLRTQPADVVHTHRYKDTVLGAIAAKLTGVPGLIRTVHGQTEPMRGWERAKFRAYEALDTLALRSFADRVVAVSRRMAAGLEESGYEPGAVVAIHNGVDLRRIRPARARDEVRGELGIAAGTPLIGTVGRLSPVKGHAHLLRAARLILESEPAARFLIVGDGPLQAELAASARELGIGHACLFVGARADVYDLLAAMDTFVLSSLDEGIPMALLEAMALGRPVVATAVGGIPEVVTHRASGLLVGARDERALADACLELTRHPDRARMLGACARRTVEEEFSHERNGLALVDAYRAIVRHPGPGRAEPLEPARHRPLLRLVRPEDRRPSAPGRGLLARGAARVGRAALHLIERRRIERVRRDPRVLVAGLRSARRILIVCHGNIIRSPFTARLLGQALGQAPGDGGRVSIGSGGLAARPGTPSPPAAVRVAARLRVDLSDHVASPVTREAVAASDVIFVMDIAQLGLMRARFPEARAKTFLLSCLAPGSALEVRDPFDGEESLFQACFAHISECVRPIVGQLAEGARNHCGVS